MNVDRYLRIVMWALLRYRKQGGGVFRRGSNFYQIERAAWNKYSGKKS